MKYSLTIMFLVFSSINVFANELNSHIIQERSNSIGLVKILRRTESGVAVHGHGSGFFIEKKYFVTNYHVVNQAVLSSLDSFTENNNEEKLNLGLNSLLIFPYAGVDEIVFKNVKVVFLNSKDDMAILEILDELVESGPQIPVRSYINSEISLKSGEKLFSLGHPEFDQLRLNKQSLIFSSDPENYEQIAVWSRYGNYPGFSGSPLFNNEGDLVALMHSYSYLSQHKESDLKMCSIQGTMGYGTKASKVKENIRYFNKHKHLIGDTVDFIVKIDLDKDINEPQRLPASF